MEEYDDGKAGDRRAYAKAEASEEMEPSLDSLEGQIEAAHNGVVALRQAIQVLSLARQGLTDYLSIHTLDAKLHRYFLWPAKV